MSKIIVMFIAGFIGLSLRYIIKGEFELNQLLSLLLFPVGALLLVFIMKWHYKKDRNFYPNEDDTNMVTRLGDRVSTTTKQMYKDRTKRARIVGFIIDGGITLLPICLIIQVDGT